MDLCSSKEIGRRPEGKENKISCHVEKTFFKTNRELVDSFKIKDNLIATLQNNLTSDQRGEVITRKEHWIASPTPLFEAKRKLYNH